MTTPLKMPSHFSDLQKAAWEDLMANVDKTHLTKENLFNLEITATLMGRFREGKKPLSATEMKEMRKLLVVFGLAKADNGKNADKQPSKNKKYFQRGD